MSLKEHKSLAVTVFPAFDNKGVQVSKQVFLDLCKASSGTGIRFECLAEGNVLMTVHVMKNDVAVVLMQRLSETFDSYSDAIDSDESKESSWIYYYFAETSQAMQAVCNFLSGMIEKDSF